MFNTYQTTGGATRKPSEGLFGKAAFRRPSSVLQMNTSGSELQPHLSHLQRVDDLNTQDRGGDLKVSSRTETNRSGRLTHGLGSARGLEGHRPRPPADGRTQ